MNTELTSGDILFVRNIKRFNLTLKKLKRIYSIVFDISSEYANLEDIAWYLNDFVFKFNLITPQKYHEEMGKILYWGEVARYFKDSESYTNPKENYNHATVVLCCKIINGTQIAKLPGYKRKKSKVS